MLPAPRGGSSRIGLDKLYYHQVDFERRQACIHATSNVYDLRMARVDTVVMVGAGVIDAAVAYALAREGRGVLLLDRAEPGMAGASCGNAGHIATELVEPLPSFDLLFAAASAAIFPILRLDALAQAQLENQRFRSAALLLRQSDCRSWKRTVPGSYRCRRASPKRDR